MPLRELLIIGVVFNMYWLIAVVGQSQFIWLLVSLLLLCWWYYSDTCRFSVILGGSGILMDLMLNKLGVFNFSQSFFPVWLALLWLGFGSFVWLMRQVIASHSPYFMIILGGLGGMMSYFAGYSLGAVMWPIDILVTMATVLVCWLVFSVLILALLRHFEKEQSKYNRKEV